MAYETALLRQSVPEVIQLLRELLQKKHFVIDEIDSEKTIVRATKKGSLFSQTQHLLLQITGINSQFTRIDVTAKLDKEGSEYKEEIIEEKIVSSIYRYTH